LEPKDSKEETTKSVSGRSVKIKHPIVKRQSKPKGDFYSSILEKTSFDQRRPPTDDV